MKYYYAKARNRSWFVTLAESKQAAHTEAVQEFGRGETNLIREATEDEITSYRREKPGVLEAEEDHQAGTGLKPLLARAGRDGDHATV